LVGGGGSVFVGRGVCVGAIVGRDSVAEGTGEEVGVSVTAPATGKLQASMARISMNNGNKAFDFILSPLL
jgi:hypothetical protein